MVQTFRKTLTLGDVTSSYDGNKPQAGEWTDIAVFKVPAQTEYAWGYGSISGGVDDRGKLYVELKDATTTPVTIEGQIRLVVDNYNRTDPDYVIDERTEVVRGSKTDKNQAFMLADSGIDATEDSYLILQLKADSTPSNAWELDNSTLQAPITATFK